MTLCIVFLAAVLTTLHTHYTTNDDTGIIGFAVAGHPVPYVGILLSSLLHSLYTAWPNIAWFGWCLYLLLAISLYQWLGLAWRLLRRPWLAATASAVILGYYLDLVVSLDFTAVSALLCMAGLARAGVEILEQRGSWSLLLPGVLFALGWLVRPESAFGAVAYAVPVVVAVLAACLWRRPFRAEMRRLVVAALVFLLPVALNAGVDAAWRAAMRTPQEARYEAFNGAAGQFYHLNRARRNATSKDVTLLVHLHWTGLDAERFVHWKFLDERLYTPEAAHAMWVNAKPAHVTVALLMRQIRARLLPANKIFLLLVASAPLFVLLVYRGRPEGVVGLFLSAYSVALTVLMYVLYAFIYRVEMPFELGLGLMGWLLAIASFSGDGGTSPQVFIAAASIGVLVAGIGAYDSAASTLRLQQRDIVLANQATKKLEILNTQFAGDVILMEPSNILSVLSPLRPISLNFHPINLGWNTFSPRFYEQIRWAGAEHGYDLIDAMVDNPKAYMLGRQLWATQLLSYAKAHSQARIRVVRVAPDVLQLQSVQSVGQMPPRPMSVRLFGRPQATHNNR